MALTPIAVARGSSLVIAFVGWLRGSNWSQICDYTHSRNETFTLSDAHPPPLPAVLFKVGKSCLSGGLFRAARVVLGPCPGAKARQRGHVGPPLGIWCGQSPGALGRPLGQMERSAAMSCICFSRRAIAPSRFTHQEEVPPLNNPLKQRQRESLITGTNDETDEKQLCTWTPVNLRSFGATFRAA
jgi:hypothetical protein